MSNVSIITDCIGNAGLEAARKENKDVILVITGNESGKLDEVKAALEAEGYEVHAFAADASVKKEIHAVFAQANLLGKIKTVVHIPETLPEAADVETILRINAVGTKNVNMEARKYMDEGGLIIDIASGDPSQVPDILVRHKTYEKAEYEEDAFMKQMVREAKMAIGDKKESAFANDLSSSFIEWYAGRCAEEYAAQGIKVVFRVEQLH